MLIDTLKNWITVVRQKARQQSTLASAQPAAWHVMTIDQCVEQVPQMKSIRRGDLRFADRMVVTTQNSEYDLVMIEDDTFLVAGGWFDREHLSPHRVRINGCTWGGSMICLDILAAPGMCMEFNNRVLTSAIRAVVVYRPQFSTSD